MIREIKCPYGDDFEGGDECDRCEQYELCMESYPPTNLIEIPKEATNGSIFTIMFPDLQVEDNGGLIYVHYPDGGWMTFIRDWWYAPYKQGNENDSN